MIKVGVVGVGLVGKKRIESIMSSKIGEIMAVCDADYEKARKLSDQYGFESHKDWKNIIENSQLDTVIVSTPNKFLRDISLAALDRGKNVLCEKPLGRNLKESEEIYLKAKKKKRILKTGFNHRHHPAIFKVKALVDKGEIGPIYYIKCIYGHGGRPGYENEWRANKDICGGGELLDQGVHVVDLFRWFLGEFSEVYGHINTFYWDMKVEDNAFAILKNPTGQTAVMHTSWTQWKNTFIFEIFGQEGYLIAEGLGGSYGTETLRVGKRKTRNQGKEGEVEYIGGVPDEKILRFPGPDISWVEEWKEFSSAIKEDRESLGSGYDGLMANKLIDAVYRSAKTGRVIRI